MSYSATWHGFTEHPLSDSCWSLSTGPDGRVYAAACCEHDPGNTVKVVRYNDEARALDYLFDLDEMVDDPRDSGRATQCKIHYSFAPSPHDGIMYMASHLSGPPIDQPSYSPWNSWHDPERCFRGAALVAFDTRGDEVLWWDTMYPKEGCRCLLHDEERGLLYSLSYPRDHLFVYDLASRSARDLGRIGSVNGQVLFLDGRHRVWTSTDDGRLARYDPDADRMEISPYILPHNPIYQTGWHSVLYDAVAAPDQPCIYAVTWIAAPRLLRIWPGEGNWGRVEDLGAVTQERDMSVPVSTFLDHSGGLVFGADGMLYYSASRWRDPVYMPEITDGEHLSEGVVWRLDPETLARDEVLVLDRPGYAAQYVSRGAIDRHGDLFFGHVGAKPVGLFRVAVPEDRKRQIAHVPMRMWG
ncbi:MAG: hypothetical protein HN742_37025 [Lentisphaerae bacterium]|nr:hypothetical protein [Lentisphaerota bacterium]MBT5611913.1 hypothetical protein [Lentisphaerota bacterium]MBT7055490.1 hypothetical protein [Lentisphaerota bacterium]MBT7847530.1 hypothetical protein [Lentisphaerota bacterium]